MKYLSFMMGEYEARFPTDRKYCRNHLWLQSNGKGHKFGLTNYAIRLLKDVYFLDWLVSSPVKVHDGQEIGSIESSKALSALFAPMDGTIFQFNEDLLDDPSTINVDGYGKGWLFEMEGNSSRVMTPEEYIKFLDDGWVKTQQAIKKQLNM